MARDVKLDRTWYGIWGGRVQVKSNKKKLVLDEARRAGFTAPVYKLREGWYTITKDSGSVHPSGARILSERAALGSRFKDAVNEFNTKGEENV